MLRSYSAYCFGLCVGVAVGCNLDSRDLQRKATASDSPAREGSDDVESSDDVEIVHTAPIDNDHTAVRDGGASVPTVSAGDVVASDSGAPPVDPHRGRTGSPCDSNAECQAVDMGNGVCLREWPEGSCSNPCIEFVDCPGTDSTVCRELDGKSRCLLACFGDLDCRDGYECDAELFGCVPK